MKITYDLGVGDHYYKLPIIAGLNAIKDKHGFTIDKVENNNEILPWALRLYIDDKLIAMVDYSDFPSLFRSYIYKDIDSIEAKCIFKYQYEDGYDYGVNHVISAGYVTPIFNDRDYAYLDVNRDIDISSQMRTHQHHPDRKIQSWSLARKTLCEIASQLKNEGYSTAINKISTDLYYNDLYRTKIGFNWRGVGFLNFRMMEYLATGVVMLTDPYHSNHPLKEGIYLEDNYTMISCQNPTDFYKESKLLLKDKSKMDFIRKNALELWNEELRNDKLAEFYYSKLLEYKDGENLKLIKDPNEL